MRKRAVLAVGLSLMMSIAASLSASVGPSPRDTSGVNQLNTLVNVLNEIQNRLNIVLFPGDPEIVPAPNGIVGQIEAIHTQLAGVSSDLNEPQGSPGGEEAETLGRIQKQATVIVSTINGYLKQGQPPDKIRLALENVSAVAQDIVDRCKELLSLNLS